MANYIVTLSFKNKNHAGSKAPSDVVKFLVGEGYEPLNLSNVDTLKYFVHPFNYLSIRRRIGAGDRIVFQLPCYSKMTAKWQLRIADYARKKGAYTVALLHDVDFLRHFGKLSKEQELSILSHFDRLIVHSEAMQEALRSSGCKVPTSILGLFSYGVRVGADPLKTEAKNAVVFAGNIGKSVFVPYLKELSGDSLYFNMYGVGAEKLPVSEYVRHKGKFNADDLSSIEGGWGLVWDGDSLDACRGYMGEYLKYNSPHKASLYLCCGLPLVVPEGSAVARIVEQYGLGIVLKSLKDIRQAIEGVSQADYEAMKENAVKFGEELKRGNNIVTSVGE